MCVIIKKPAGIKLDRKIYETCFENNGHGAGLCYVKDRKLVISKGFGKLDELYDQEIQPNEELELIIHFRVASAGMKVDADNCHPFSSKSRSDGGYEFALVHNGTLDWRSTKDESDTNCFNQDFMVPIMNRDPWYFDQDVNRFIFERGVLDHQGRTNKMVILRYNIKRGESKVYILNEKKGVQAHGCWFSNKSYEPKPKHEPHGLELWRFNNGGGSKWIHRLVKGKWLDPIDWMGLVSDERERLSGSLVGPALEAWNKKTYEEQSSHIEKWLGFDCHADEKKTPSILDEEKARKLSKHEAMRGVVRNKSASKWLDEAQRKMLSMACIRHCKKTQGIDSSDWTIAEMMDWTRQDYRDFEDGCKHLEVAALDKYIIAVYEQEGNSKQDEPAPTVIADREFECYY